MIFRPASTKDIAPLSNLIKDVIGSTPYYTDRAKKEEIKKHNKVALKQYLREKKYYTCLVAKDKKRLVGFVIGRTEAGVFWLDWVGVHRDMRRKKVAETLLKNIEYKVKKQGVHKIWCDTRDTNKESIPLIKKLNYKKLGYLKNGWYKQDFLLWQKDLKN
jgi:ribosomal protein S18 acetylase RimI-like enzyme